MQRNALGYEFPIGLILILLCLGSAMYHVHLDTTERTEQLLHQTLIREEQTRMINRMLTIHHELQKALGAIMNADQLTYNDTF